MGDDSLHNYEEQVSAVYAYLAYRLGSRTAAEDLTERTIERAFRDREWPHLKPSEARMFLLRIAREAAGDHGSAGGGEGDDPGIAPDLREALERLGREDRSVLALRYGAGLRPREIAGVHDVSEGSALRALSRSLRRLRTELDRRERTHSGTTERRSVPPGLPRRHQ